VHVVTLSEDRALSILRMSTSDFILFFSPVSFQQYTKEKREGKRRDPLRIRKVPLTAFVQ
jgi:hypothetical protein